MRSTCWLTRRRLDAYRDDELPATLRAEVESHLGRCPGCARESAALDRLRMALVADAPEPSEAVWNAFWPRVRARMAAAPPAPEPLWRRVWGEVLGPRRLVLGSVLAGAALAVVAVLTPWDQLEAPRPLPVGPSRGVTAAAPEPGAPVQQVLVQSVETLDPQSSVMVYASPESEVTVVWVFGLEPTDI